MQRDTIANAAAMARYLADKGYRIVAGGTDNHQVLVDLEAKKLSGAQAEQLLEDAGLVSNRNVVPRDAQQPGRVSGLRLGTGAITARGMGREEVRQIVDWIDQVLGQSDDPGTVGRVRKEVEALCRRYPVYANGHDPLMHGNAGE